MSYNNYHTHTTFCDGKNTPEEMVLAALAAGCEELGFSGHSYLPFDPDWTMDPAVQKQYRNEILRLKQAYQDRISIRLGLEQDTCSELPEEGLYEYLIGAVHCVFRDGHYLSVDASQKAQRDGVFQWYGGDPYAFVEDYYEAVSQVYEKTHCQILAHFDLITKFIEIDDLIDPADARYVQAADRALEQVLETPMAIEINTGAISRGMRTAPYPEERLLARIGKARHPVILSSDSHAKDTIVYGFDRAIKLVEQYDLNLLTKLDDLLQ